LKLVKEIIQEEVRCACGIMKVFEIEWFQFYGKW